MECNIDKIFDFFRGELNDLETARMLDHMDTCKPCSEDFNSIKLIYVNKVKVFSESEQK